MVSLERREESQKFFLNKGGLKTIAGLGLAGGLLFLAACLPSKPIFTPLPGRVTSIEGYASLRLTRSGEVVRARFSFLFLLPEQGTVEVLDSLGRVGARLFLLGNEAVLVLPSHHVYWRAGQEEAMEKLLGFGLKLAEMVALLQGKGELLVDWKVERDERQRVVKARRGDMRLTVEAFFGETDLPQRLLLYRGGEKGDLKVLRLRFNQPLKGGVLDLSFLDEGNYRPARWEEIERLMRDED